MKTFKKVLTILLSLVIALPLFTSCKDKEHNDSGVIQETDIDLVKEIKADTKRRIAKFCKRTESSF